MTYDVIAADGQVFHIHTEVGDGFTKVCIDTPPPVEEQSIDQPGDE